MLASGSHLPHPCLLDAGDAIVTKTAPLPQLSLCSFQQEAAWWLFMLGSTHLGFPVHLRADIRNTSGFSKHCARTVSGFHLFPSQSLIVNLKSMLHSCLPNSRPQLTYRLLLNPPQLQATPAFSGVCRHTKPALSSSSLILENLCSLSSCLRSKMTTSLKTITDTKQ